MRGMVAESATRASAWTHPRTGETRIYINTLPGQGSAKVWVEALPRPDAFGLDYTIRVKGERLSRGEAGNLANDAERWLEQLGNPYYLVLQDIEGRTALDFGIYGAPETFLIDGRGRIAWKHVGVLTPALIHNELLPALARVEARR